ncbi:MAG: hypothetical protein AB1633_05905 [Elusimicrobiota bacterium]
MYEVNIKKVLQRIGTNDVVLDIGGWAQPFNRANYVIDVMPYETRGFFGKAGSEKEYFSKDTWINHDVSGKNPLPFENKKIDFAICSHILEDIRDPLFLCSELIRVAKKGYIEVPSRIMESIMGVQNKHYAGFSHHRWLIEIKNSEIVFLFKSHLIHNSWKYHLPESYLKKITDEEKITYLFWENSFKYKEIIQVSIQKTAQELETFIKSKNVYPPIFYKFDKIMRELKYKTFIKKKLNKYPELKKIVERIRGKPFQNNTEDAFWLNQPDYFSH